MAEQLYAVMTDSPYPCDKRVLARKVPASCGPRNWWTHILGDAVWLMPLDKAKEVASDYQYNNPRIVRSKKAIAILENQTV